MPIAINGTGTITGISAGGLPDASVTADELASGAVTTAKVNDGAITYGKLSTSATESDNVAKRTAKAWVNFNGTGTVAIRDDFNVSSITDNGTGDYSVNFSAALSNSDYVVCGFATNMQSGFPDTAGNFVSGRYGYSQTTGSSGRLKILQANVASANDDSQVFLIFFGS